MLFIFLVLPLLFFESAHSIFKLFVKFDHRFLLHAFILPQIGFWQVMFVDDMIQFFRISNFDLYPNHIEFFSLLSQNIPVAFVIINIQKVNSNVFINAILVAIFLAFSELLSKSVDVWVFFQFTLLFESPFGLFLFGLFIFFHLFLLLCKQILFFLVFYSLRFLWVHSAQNNVVYEIQEVEFLTIGQFYPFDFYHFKFVLLHSYIDDAAACVEVTHDSFCEMGFYRLVLEWPPVVFELLVCTLTKTTHITVCQMFEMNFAAHVFFRLCLDSLSFLFDPIQDYFFQQTMWIFYKKFLINEIIDFPSRYVTLS